MAVGLLAQVWAMPVTALLIAAQAALWLHCWNRRIPPSGERRAPARPPVQWQRACDAC